MSGASPLRVYGWLAAGIAALGWSAVLIRLADAPPLSVAAYRMAGGAACLLPFAGGAIRAQWRLLAPRERALWAASAVFLALHFALWIESLRHTSVASSVVLVTTNPVFAGLGGWLLLGEKEKPSFWAGVACAFAGGVLLAWSDARAWEGSAWGNLLALGGAVLASAYLLCGRRLRGRVPLLPYVALCYGLSGLLLMGAAGLAGQPLAGFSLETWLLLAALAAGPTLLGHTAVNYALAHLPPGRVALAILGEPVAAAALAWWLLAEPLTPARAAAGGLILAGIAWGSRPGREGGGGRRGVH
ncbi:MAG: DMT family transporter [Candidatus Tectomicrobia bacterium]|nr:DMT family transporter [Candidatus Tectomicrobia bacterium]